MMKAILVKSILAAAVSLSCLQAGATVVTFEGITTNAIDYSASGSYAGYSWTNVGLLDAVKLAAQFGPPDDSAILASGYMKGRVSGNYVALNWDANPVTFGTTDGSNFVFNGGYFSGAWNDRLRLTFTGYVDGVEVFHRYNLVDTTGPKWLSFDWSIDALTIESTGGVDAGYGLSGPHFALDNFTINVPQGGTIPEPTSLALLGLGLVGAAVVRRRAKV